MSKCKVIAVAVKAVETSFNRTDRRKRRTANRHLGTAAFGLSEAIPKGYIHQSSHKRQA